MKIVSLSDLHIGKWENYGMNLLKMASTMTGDVLWLNGDIIEPKSNINEELVFTEISKLKEYYDHIVWVAGNNCLELKCLSDQIINYRYELSGILHQYGIQLLDDRPLFINDYALIGSIGWSNGDLWTKSSIKSNEPNDRVACIKAAEVYFSKIFGDRWTSTSAEFNSSVKDKLNSDILSALKSDRKIILGTHFVTSKDFCMYGNNPRFDYLNWYMGFDGINLYKYASPVIGLVGHTHRSKVVLVGETKVWNISGAKEPFVFDF